DANDVPVDRQPGIPMCTTPEHHTLIVARTRTGKGTRVIIPTLLRYSGSMVVIDPKGENAAVTARPRLFAKLADKVHVINPWGELAAVYQAAGIPQDTFNPLDVLDRGDPNAVAIAQGLAGAVCPSAPGDKDRYWQGSAANIFAAVLLWITDQPGEHKTLARAREIASLSRKDFTDNFLVPMSASSAFGGAIREMVSPYLDLAQETYSGIMANLSENTKFLSDPQVKAATANSTFALSDLLRERRTVYLVIPPDRIDTQRTWLRLMLAAVSHTYRRAPMTHRGPHRCLVLIDEFPALGKIDDMPRDLATLAGYGLDFALIVQGIDQLRDLYGKAAGTILSNCAYKWFCNVNDLESAKYLSETLGKKTVRTVGRSEREGQDGESVNYGETGRLLLTPDEILNLGREVAIVTHPGGDPHYLRPIDYWNLQAAFRQLQARYPETFWDPPLAYDPNPYYAQKQAGGQQQNQQQGQRQEQDRQRRQERAAPPRSGHMSRAEALAILGLAEGATTEDIRAAWKRLMQKLHPDTGGSTRLAQMLTEARDALLSEQAPK
ncbi:MAG: type IV secretory system conjugative DNA transfer family protein, partial [Rhodospirillaceae bacterium]